MTKVNKNTIIKKIITDFERDILNIYTANLKAKSFPKLLDK